MTGIRFPVGAGIFLFVTASDSGVLPASYAVVPALSGQGVKLTTYFHLVPRLKIRGDVPPPRTCS